MSVLPLGSIVMLKGATKKLMVYGRFQMNAIDDTMFDYVGCMYPEGNLSAECTFLFNESDIQEIIFEGFTDEDDEKYIKAVQEAL